MASSQIHPDVRADDGQFVTWDVDTASACMMKGRELQDIQFVKSENRGYFLFDDREKCFSILDSMKNGDMQGSISDFVRNKYILLRMLKVEREKA